MADTAYDADPLRQAIAAKGAIAVIPNNRHERSNIGSTSISTPAPPGGVLFCRNSSNSAEVQLASKRPYAITAKSTLAAIILWMR